MFEEFMNELERIKEQIIKLYSPYKIILFGSLAKRQIKKSSDIDLCIIIDTDNKRALIAKMLFEIEAKFPLDIVLYTNEEWENWKDEKTSFLHKILSEGVVMYGR